MTLLDRLLLNKLATKKSSTITVHDEYSESTTEPYSANYVNTELDKKFIVEKNAGAHNSIYRGKDITDLFYDGTLSTQIAAGTFDDIFVGDYIIGQTSGRKYLVADINYRLHTGNTECTTNHVLMIPEKIMGTAKMNDSDVVTGAYSGSKMYTTNLASFISTIEGDFGSGHILSHDNMLTSVVSGNNVTSWAWRDNRKVDIMSEVMVFGHNSKASTPSFETGADKKQLAIFMLNQSLMIGINDNNERAGWWLRDIASSTKFTGVTASGFSSDPAASSEYGVRPAFLVY